MVGAGAQGSGAARVALGVQAGLAPRAGRARKEEEKMPFIRRQWTPREADEWTREDTITVIISPLIYVLLMIGTALSMLGMWYGFAILAVGIVLLLVMFWIINPKLSSISGEYEKKQKGYLEELERTVKWEE